MENTTFTTYFQDKAQFQGTFQDASNTTNVQDIMNFQETST
jgi:hypothetical protein